MFGEMEIGLYMKRKKRGREGEILTMRGRKEQERLGARDRARKSRKGSVSKFPVCLTKTSFQ